MDPFADLPSADELAADLHAALAPLRVKARRLVLDTPGVAATVPMLRGVWGAALHDHDPVRYATVFEGRRETDLDQHPLYLLRPAPADPVDWPAVDWITMGAALDQDAPLVEAWVLAAARGLGRERHRFAIRAIKGLEPNGLVRSGSAEPFSLDRIPQPLNQDALSPACRLRFDVPVRMLRRGLLIDRPTLPDIVAVGLRRLSLLASDGVPSASLSMLNGPTLAWARALPAEPWIGRPAHLHRYSANQGELELQGVVGSLDLPDGPGPLWPLLAALTWVHLGKGTVFGLGQLRIEAIP